MAKQWKIKWQGRAAGSCTTGNFSPARRGPYRWKRSGRLHCASVLVSRELSAYIHNEMLRAASSPAHSHDCERVRERDFSKVHTAHTQGKLLLIPSACESHSAASAGYCDDLAKTLTHKGSRREWYTITSPARRCIRVKIVCQSTHIRQHTRNKSARLISRKSAQLVYWWGKTHYGAWGS